MHGYDFKSLRRSAKLTQAQVAEALGVDKQTVSRWERSVHRVKFKVAKRMFDLVSSIKNH